MIRWGYAINQFKPQFDDFVRRRVAAGGHDIPDATIRERFSKSLNYLNELYKPIVDEWYIWNSLEGDFQLAEAWDD